MTILEKLIKTMNGFGIGANVATNEQIRDRFDEDVANAIIEERRIACWHVGLPIGAMLGSFLTILFGWLV